ncbi:hypothetical protein K2173_010587 [Erythroxylum novogranatense]|uniref:WEB family protein n=1 Tax=Erythroxylum novogranatense TaxID=1862640 RepID=A0AAV8TGH0_9ROSI|nr:hypothetical protein K2173_010587 [Erythroxylum novogranatense]
MVATDKKRTTDSPKVGVGEIDTRAPFQSVKDAVTLFGEGALSAEKPTIRNIKPYSAERALARETQLHLAQKELNRLKDQVKNAETKKAQAFEELEKAKRTVEDLSKKLETVTESKISAIRSMEAATNQAKRIEETKDGSLESDDDSKQDLESTRQQYVTVFTGLDVAKQELRKIRQECDASLEAKLAAFNQVAEAENAARVNMEKVGKLSKEISALQESIGQVKLAALQAQQEQVKVFTEKDAQKQSYKESLEASADKLLALKKEFDPELPQNLENQLAKAINENGSLQNQMESAKASDLGSVRTVTSELDGAKESMLKVAEEESSLQNLVESLKLELESVKKEHSELKEQEAETESITGNLHVKLRKTKSELETALSEESKARGVSEEMILTLSQLSLEAGKARQDAEEMKIKAELLRSETEATRIALDEAEKKLRVALEEADEAKLAEEKALYQIKTLSERTNAARASTSESGAKITISKEEFESLSRKVEESDTLAKMKVAAAMAQVDAVKAGENEAHQRLDTMRKEMEDMRSATEEALKKAEMAEAAKRAVEGELRRWREREQKKVAETATRILAETDMSSESSPHHYRIQKENQETQKVIEFRKLGKEKSSASKKALVANLSGIFHRKKNQVEGGSAFLAGQKSL